MMDSLVNKFNQQAMKHMESQTLNPFSDRFNRSPSPRPKFSKEEYGKPVAGSKTDIRGQKAFTHINREILELCECIHDIGHHRQDPDDGSPQVLVPFGELFAVYSRISDKVSGLLIAAKKRGYVYFEPEILFQRRDDDEIVALVMPMSEIKAHVKAALSSGSTSPAPSITSLEAIAPKQKSKSPSPTLPPTTSTTSEAIEPVKAAEGKKEEVSKSSAPTAPAPSVEALPTPDTEKVTPTSDIVEAPSTDNQTSKKVLAETKPGAITPSEAPADFVAPVENSASEHVTASENTLVDVASAPIEEASTGAKNTELKESIEDTTSLATLTAIPSNNDQAAAVTLVEDVRQTPAAESSSSTVEPAEVPSSPELPADYTSIPASSAETTPSTNKNEEPKKPAENIKYLPTAETATNEETPVLEATSQELSTEEASRDDVLTMIMYVPVEEAPSTDEVVELTKPLELNLAPSAEAPSSDKGEQTLA